jgi:hypothetical protein
MDRGSMLSMWKLHTNPVVAQLISGRLCMWQLSEEHVHFPNLQVKYVDALQQQDREGGLTSGLDSLAQGGKNSKMRG